VKNRFSNALDAFSRTDRVGVTLMRLAIAIVFFWIGALKFVPYEADSITPFVANSPVMSFFYAHPDEYKGHLTHEGQLIPAQRTWQEANHTYTFSRGLGVVEWLIGLLVLAYPLSKRLGLAGAFLSFMTTLVTLSFLFTTPEAWVPALGDAQHGFPYLSGAGRLVIKDTMMLAGAWIIGVDAAKGILADRRSKAKSMIATMPAPGARQVS
jgi:reactive chlorine resistance protein C